MSKTVSRRKALAAGAGLIPLLICILLVAYFLWIQKTVWKGKTPHIPTSSTLPSITTTIEETTSKFPTQTSLSAINNVVFPTFPVDYPAEWPDELRFPEQLILVDAISGKSSDERRALWSAKLIFHGSPESAADLLVSFFTERGWIIEQYIKGRSGEIVVLIQRDDHEDQGSLVFDSDIGNVKTTRIVATVFP